MKIAFDARYLNGPSSGIGTYCLNLLRELLRLDPELRLLLVTREAGLKRRFESDRCDELVFRAHPRSFSTLYRLPRRLRNHSFDLFHGPFNILPSGLDCPSVVTIHDIMQLQNPANIATSTLVQQTAGLFWRTRIRHAAEHASHVVAVSETTRDAVLEYFPRLSADRVTVTANGVDPYFFEEPTEAESAQARAMVGDTPFVLCVGNESPHKNHHRAVEAFMCAFAGQSHRFVLVRRSVRRDGRMQALLRRPEVAAQCLVLEHVDLAVLRALYRSARIFFFPSWIEGFGIPILEAMASGTPVVTGDRSAPAEVAGDAAAKASPFDVGQLADALRRVDTDEALRGELIERGRARASEFTWERCARATLAAYQATLRRGTAAR